ncbi:MAG: histidine kinase, partial [Bacteroidota bacterium]
TNLPAGDFEFKYKAINSDGVESEIFSLPLMITPPFYKTLYFYLLVLAVIVAGVYMLYKYRIRQILKLQEVRNKIARDLHDDIGSTLGSIHLYSQIANKKLKGEKPEEVKSILEKIESSSGEIIEKTGDAIWAVKASNDTLKNLILRIEGYTASLFGTAGIRFTIDYDENLSNTKLEMTQRKNIFLIYKEAVHNIIKYADCSEVKIQIKKNANKMHIIISDNGKGFIQNGTNPYNGNGIKNMQFRAEEIKGRLLISSQPGEGTSIDLEV